MTGRKSFYFVPFLLSLTCSLSFGQQNYREGTIINLKNDSVHGKIDYREWNTNPTRIRFTDSAGKVSDFSPDDIRGFVIPPKDRYISARVSMDMTSLKTADVTSYEGPKTVGDTALFLMTVVKGKASLYYLKDRFDREHYYVSKDHERPVELLVKKNYVSSGEGSTVTKSYIATVELFKGQLIVLFSDCPEMKDKINQGSYSSGSLRSLVLKYNECRNAPVEFVKTEEKVKVKFGLLAGPALTKVTFKGGADDLTGVKMSNSFSFLAGVSLHLIFPRERAQWSLVNELVYKPYSNTGTKDTTDWLHNRYIMNFSFDVAYLKLNTFVRYQYPAWKVRPFADFGFSNSYAIKSENSKTIEAHTAGMTSFVTGPAIENPKLYEFGFIGGIGVSWWKIGGEFRYEWAQGMSPYTELRAPENSFYFIFSFVF